MCSTRRSPLFSTSFVTELCVLFGPGFVKFGTLALAMYHLLKGLHEHLTRYAFALFHSVSNVDDMNCQEGGVFSHHYRA